MPTFTDNFMKKFDYLGKVKCFRPISTLLVKKSFFFDKLVFLLYGFT